VAGNRLEVVNLIEVIDWRLKDWVSSVIENVLVSFRTPGAETADSVGLYLMELREKKPPSTGTRPPLQLSLRYLVTARATEPEQAHNLLGRLVFAAMENPEFTVQLEPVPAAVWSAFGVPPQPCFLLDVPLRQERPMPAVGLVRQPLIVSTAPLTAFRGIVMGDGDIPLSGARVEVPAMRLFAVTDRKGVFHFDALPAGRPIQLVVHAKGKALPFTAAGHRVSQDSPFVIQFPVLEE
jgi:Pvc16 N-terminal domain